MNTNQNKKFFIVDDDPFWTGVLINMLTSFGYRNIQAFESGEECVKNMHLKPDTIFLDYQMEGLDGIEVLNQLKKHTRNTNIIFATAHEDLNIAMTALDYGSKDYILKTKVTKKELKRIVDKDYHISDNNQYSKYYNTHNQYRRY